jgi:hypothetical protein
MFEMAAHLNTGWDTMYRRSDELVKFGRRVGDRVHRLIPGEHWIDAAEPGSPKKKPTNGAAGGI